MPTIPALRRLKQENLEFKASLSYLVLKNKNKKLTTKKLKTNKQILYIP
jgi:hypothetical protein